MYVEQYKTMYSVYVGSELLDNDNATTRNVLGFQCINRVAATNISEMQSAEIVWPERMVALSRQLSRVPRSD